MFDLVFVILCCPPAESVMKVYPTMRECQEDADKRPKDKPPVTFKWICRYESKAQE